MSKRGLWIAIGLLVVAAVWSPHVAAQQKYVADKVVAVVGNSMVLLSDMEEMSRMLVQQRREEGYTSDRDPMCEALEKLMQQKLLANQAQIDSLKVNVGDIGESVDRAIQQELAVRGSQAALEAYYHKPIFDIKEDMRYRYEEGRYAQTMESSVREKVVTTPGEVERFYKSLDKADVPMVPEQYVYAQIVKYPPSIEEAKFRTKERLLEMRARILKGDRFDALARMYSEDPGSAARGGEMDFTPKEGLVAPFADAMSKLKVNQISEVVETEFGFHIIQLLEKRDNLYRCRHILLKPQFTTEEIQLALNSLDSISGEVKTEKLTFSDAALRFSEDKYSRLNGGIVTNHDALMAYNAFDPKMASSTFFKEDLPKTDFQSLRDLKEGDISSAFTSQDMRGNSLAKVIQLVKVIPSHPATLKGDYLRIEELTLKDKSDRIFHEWLLKKIAGMYIRVDDEFRGCEFEVKELLK